MGCESAPWYTIAFAKYFIANGVTAGSDSTTNTTQTTQGTASLATSMRQASNAPTSSPTSSDGAGDQSNGLSKGVKIGVGVGVAVGTSFLVALGAVFFWSRARAKHNRVPAHFPADQKGNYKPVIDAPKFNEVDGSTARHEMPISGGRSDSGALHELPLAEGSSYRPKRLFLWR